MLIPQMDSTSLCSLFAFFAFFFLLLLLLLANAGFGDLGFGQTKHALRFVPAIFIHQLLNPFVPLQNVAGTRQSIAPLETLVNTHRVDSS